MDDLIVKRAREILFASGMSHQEISRLLAERETLRDKFAMAIMSGLMARESIRNVEYVYRMADEMLAEREKK